MSTVTRDFHVLKPKPLAARPFNQFKTTSPQIASQQTNFYTATAGPPYHNQNITSETSTHMETREIVESSQHILNVSSSRKFTTYDHQQQQQQQEQQQQQLQQYHQSQGTYDKPFEPFPFSVSPTPSLSRSKLRPPPTPTKFIPGEFRESDYDSEIESIKIRPIWTPNLSESERINYRHVSPPTPNRCASVPRHHFERIMTPMEFDVNTVEMPSQISGLPASSPTYLSQQTQQQHQFKTQTLDRFRSKKKTSSQFGTSCQDDINVMHSTPKYSRIRSPSMPYHEESRASQYGKLFDFDSLFYFNNHLVPRIA